MKILTTLLLTLTTTAVFAVPPYSPVPPPRQRMNDPTPEAAQAQRYPPFTNKDVGRAVVPSPAELPHLVNQPYAPYPVSPYDTTQGRTTDPVVAAQDEAAHWLGLLDQAQYGPSWLDSGPIMKDLISEKQWIGAMIANRRPYGSVMSRRPNGNASTTTLTYGTKGNFMIVHYQTLFSRNIQAEETVILMQNQLGQWRVISYSLE